MGDRVGLFVMLAVVVILLIGLVVVGPRHTRRNRDASESLNSHRDETERAGAITPRAPNGHTGGQPAGRHHHRGRVGRGAARRGSRARGAARGRPPGAPRAARAPPPPLAAAGAGPPHS